MSRPILTFDHASRFFGGLVAVDDCTLELGEGELVGLVGPNGAGKSTLFNLASGYLPPSEGRVTVLGQPTSGFHPAELAARGLARTFQTPVAFQELTALDNVLVAAHVDRPFLRGLSGSWKAFEERNRKTAGELLERVGLAARAEVEAGELSGGELRMLEVARQLYTNPRLLLLDEPTAGVAPHLQSTLGDLIRSVNHEGVTAMVVEHNLGFLLDLVDRVVCMAGGAIIADGTPDEIRTNPVVAAAYLGDEG
jgi:branched-chain amino acid transport system ATP-binding protein